MAPSGRYTRLDRMENCWHHDIREGEREGEIRLHAAWRLATHVLKHHAPAGATQTGGRPYTEIEQRGTSP